MSRRLRKRRYAIDAKHYQPMDDALQRILSVDIPPPITKDFDQELERNATIQQIAGRHKTNCGHARG